jgi:hypothetical protein
MNKSRLALVTALGTMTPALLVEEEAKAHAAHQATVEDQRGALNVGLDQEAMKSALLALSPAEKLRLAGDRIRLAAKKKAKAKNKSRKATPNRPLAIGDSYCGCGVNYTCLAKACSGMLFA